LGWALIAGFLPPHRPYADARAIAEIFAEDRIRIRIGMVMVMFGALILIPFTAVISQFLARIEGRPGVLTYTALLGGAGTMVLTFYPAVWWLVAAFRPERSAELVYVLNDMAWLQLIGGVSLFFALPASLAAAAFVDSSDQPVFPRWSGFFNIWTVVVIIPDQLLFFFQSGPFSWNGLFGFWLPFAIFAPWFLVISHLLRKAILRERLVTAGGSSTANEPVQSVSPCAPMR
jgi:MFS family permease